MSQTLTDLLARNNLLVKYIFVGGSAFGAEYVSFLFLFYILNLLLLLSNTLSFVVGFLGSFIVNRGWTFKAGHKYKWAAHHQLAAYLILALCNLGVSNFIIYELNKILPAVYGKFIATAVIAVWNFVIFRMLIFKTTQRKIRT